MKKSKFNLLFETVMNELKNNLNPNELVISTLKVYNFRNGSFNDIAQEIDNFHYINPNNESNKLLEEYTIQDTDLNKFSDQESILKKIIVYKKQSNEIICEYYVEKDNIDIIIRLLERKKPI